MGKFMNAKLLKLNMSNSMNATALSILCLLLVGCIPPVGGPCSYEQHEGTAEVIGIKDGYYQLKFTWLPKPNVEFHSTGFFPVSRLNGDVFEVRTTHAEVAGAVIGSRFHAEASVMTKGTCVPVDYRIGAPIKVVSR